jgi:hypothetical protein
MNRYHFMMSAGGRVADIIYFSDYCEIKFEKSQKDFLENQDDENIGKINKEWNKKRKEFREVLEHIAMALRLSCDFAKAFDERSDIFQSLKFNDEVMISVAYATPENESRESMAKGIEMGLDQLVFGIYCLDQNRKKVAEEADKIKEVNSNAAQA